MTGLVAACWSPGPDVAAGGLLGWWAAVRRPRGEHEESIEVLSDVDRLIVESDFATHRSGLTAQMTEDADGLAGDDALLRARLWKIQEGRQRA